MHAGKVFVLLFFSATLTQRLDSWRFTGCSPQGGGAAGCRGIRVGCGGARFGHGCRGLFILEDKEAKSSHSQKI